MAHACRISVSALLMKKLDKNTQRSVILSQGKNMKGALMRFAGQRGTANASNIQAASWACINVRMDPAQGQLWGALAWAGPPSFILSLVGIILEGQKSKSVVRFGQLRAFISKERRRSNGTGKIIQAKRHRILFSTRNIKSLVTHF
jgi:hypothetical protein